MNNTSSLDRSMLDGKAPCWGDFCKKAQVRNYTIGGGIAGAIAGGSLAAILSALHYGGKKKKKQSLAKKIIKSLLWTGLGAAGGGLAGAGIGRAIAVHIKYKRALEAAKKELKERRERRAKDGYNYGTSPRKGRAFYVNFPENRFPMEGLYKKLFGDDVPIQHASLLTMDEDGGDAVLFSPGMDDKASAERTAKRFLEQGKENNDPKLIEEANNILTGKIDRAFYAKMPLFNALKGKSDKEIAQFLADLGHHTDWGPEVHIYEGDKGIDRDLVEDFLENAHRVAHIDGNPGYSIVPGAYNCGTASREGLDAVQNTQWSHWLDMLLGGFPSHNAPILSNETSARYFKDENRADLAHTSRFSQEVR